MGKQNDNDQEAKGFDALEDRLTAKFEQEAEEVSEAQRQLEAEADEARDQLIESTLGIEEPEEEEDEEAVENTADTEDQEDDEAEEESQEEEPSDDESLVTLKGPWGEERLDPRDPEQLKKIVEYGQKGRNYDELLAKDDERVRRRAQEVAERQQFDLYLRLGLVRVNGEGKSEWTDKGLSFLAEQNGAQPAARDNAQAAGSSDADDQEVDSLLEKVLTADDPNEAKEALRSGMQKLASRVGREAAEAAVDARWKQLDEQRAQERAQREQQQSRERITQLVQTQFQGAIDQHEVFKGDADLVAFAKQRVRRRFQEMAQAEANGDTTLPSDPQARIDLALQEVGAVVSWAEGKEARGVTRFREGAKKRKSKGPPATGGGTAAPVKKTGKSKAKAARDKREGLLGDSFQRRVLERLRG